MQPSPLETPQTAPEVQAAVAAVRSVVENAKPLGLVWNLRPAEVMVDSPDPNLVEVIMDGDSVSINVVSLIGPLGANQRVMVAIVPPAGMFIIGQPNSGAKLSRYSSTNNTATALSTGGNILTDTSIDVPARAGQSWKATAIFDFGVTVSGIGVAVGFLSLNGVAESRQAIYQPATTGRQTTPQQWSGTFATTETVTFVLSCQKTAAGGTGTCFNLHTDLEIEVYEAGLIYP